MGASHYILAVWVPLQVEWTEDGHRRSFDRDGFLGFLWERFSAEAVGDAALQGIHEGTLLSDEAFKQGFETESFTLDSGEAPRERDWIGAQTLAKADLYFSSRQAAESARAILTQTAPDLRLEKTEEQLPRDWDAEWKKSFQGVSVAPNWEVRPPWVDMKDIAPDRLLLRLNPGAGFGTGTHETTQLCLELLSRWHARVKPASWKVLDFGSGSGILAVGAALLGARVEGVEIDELAIDNAVENARLNSIESRIEWRKTMKPEPQAFDLIFANILKPVLLQFAPELVRRVKTGGALILSGLIEKDLEEIIPRYEPLFGNPPEAVIGKNEWRALLWSDRP